MPTPRRPHRRVAAGAAIGTALVAVAAGCGRAGFPDPASDQAEDVLREWRTVLAIATALGVFVVLLLGVAVVRGLRARRRGDEPSANSGSVRWELAYTIVPLLLVGAVFALSVVTDRAIARHGGDPDVQIEVVAFQWGWTFDYGDGRVVRGQAREDPVLVLPVGRSVRLELRGRDVIHSLFVPVFGTKLDVVPGRVNTLDVRPNRTGTFLGQCAEFCGIDHAHMNFVVRVVDDEEYRRWLDGA
ncbi:cytochrome c oxidase subunit II [Dermatobacter hominis]|uniref:cytochrome c oxidase subunit II n=1 Tax=Dermatobacter hominis TaxID=2884263 RepID=UPI001D10884B|nr:cytochrome c oxidase subunit II [Dermatobacter hominis]UDY34164.1 cytochrome c oxidase subunit II [Dermatobacter hominis]